MGSEGMGPEGAGADVQARVSPRWALLFSIGFAVIAADQLTKALVRAELDPGQGVAFAGPFAIQHLQNPGIAGGGLQGSAVPLALLATSVVLAILAFLARAGVARPLVLVGFGLLMGGGFGNLLDRMRLGHVTDFILRDDRAFNVADVAIFLGGTVVLAALVALLPQVRLSQPTRSGE
jgi:signal peptidase II